MALIEGVGDEVTVLVAALLLLLIVCLAWISTSVPDLGGIRVIILDHTNFHRLGEIARRYQIIGYQIISGHMIHHRVHNGNQDDNQSGAEGDDVSDGSSAEDSTQEGSAEEDSPFSSRNGSTENINQSEPGISEPDMQSPVESVASSVTAQQPFVHISAESLEHTSDSNISQPIENVPQDNFSVGNFSATAEYSGEDSSFSAQSDINTVSETDSCELRRRRLAFYDKSDVGVKTSQNENSTPNIDNIDNSSGNSASISDNSNTSDSLDRRNQPLNIESTNRTESTQGDTVQANSASSRGNDQVTTESVHTDTTSTIGSRGVTPEGVQTSTASSTDGAPVDSEDLPAGHMRIRIKYLDDRQRQVDAIPTETIGEFKRKHFAGELAENMLVRFIHNGRELRHDASTLQACNIRDGSVIHCLLTRGVQQEERSNQQVQDEEFNMGALMFPLFGLILATIWYCRFTYRHYFNAMSTLILIGITLLYVIAGMAMYRHHVDHHHPHHHPQHHHPQHPHHPQHQHQD